MAAVAQLDPYGGTTVQFVRGATSRDVEGMSTDDIMELLRGE